MEYKELFASSYPEDLEPIVKLLSSYKIEYRIEVERSEFNPYTSVTRPPDGVKVMVREDEFQISKDILLQAGLIQDVSEDEGLRQMLGGLDNDELREMVVNPDDHPADQVAMAQLLLNERGIVLEPRLIVEERQAMAVQERKPRNMNGIGKAVWVLFTFLIPPVGFAVSLAVLLLKVKDVEGKQYSFYNDSTRFLAVAMLIISSAIMLVILWLHYRNSQYSGYLFPYLEYETW